MTTTESQIEKDLIGTLEANFRAKFAAPTFATLDRILQEEAIA